MAKNENSSSGHRKRLRGRFLKSSLDGFHDYEILELILTYAIPRRDVKPLAKELIRRFKSVGSVLSAPEDELTAVKGMGENAALLFRIFREAAGAYLEDSIFCKRPVRSPGDVLEFLGFYLKDKDGDRFAAVYLNTKNEILAVETLDEGELKGLKVSARKAIEMAFSHNARSIIFVRKSGAGKTLPSGAERALAKELEEAASAVDIIVHDHLFIGREGHFSARESGWLKRR